MTSGNQSISQAKKKEKRKSAQITVAQERSTTIEWHRHTAKETKLIRTPRLRSMLRLIVFDLDPRAPSSREDYHPMSMAWTY
eukprot:4693470-Amphidinium_carterae.1